MKKTLLMLTLLLAPLAMSAQSTFAHFSLADVMQALPDYRKAIEEVEALRVQYRSELETMQTEITTKIEKYQKEVNEQTPDDIRERRYQEIIQLQQRYEQTEQDYSTALQTANSQKMEPIMKRVLDAVTKVAGQGNFVYVMDKTAATSNNIIINEALSVDVTSRIMDALGITPEDIAAGKAFVQRMQQQAQSEGQ